MVRNSHPALFALATIAALMSAGSVLADWTLCVGYDPNDPNTTPITMVAGPRSIRVGDPLPFDSSGFDDIDHVVGSHDGEYYNGYYHDNVTITKVWICKPCGLSITLNAGGSGGAQTISGWVADEPGLYRVLVTVDNSGDPPFCGETQEFELTFQATRGSDCPSCAPPGPDWWVPSASTGFDAEGILARFALGTHADGKSAGAVELRATEPAPSLATPAALHYAIAAPDIEVIHETPSNPATALRQILTPQLLADIVTIDAYQYELYFYTLQEVGEKVGGFYGSSGNSGMNSPSHKHSRMQALRHVTFHLA